MGFTWHPTSPPDPVSSYLTLSPLPAFANAPAGGLLSVALSLGLPPLDVIQHHALWSPDFPLPRKGQRSPGLLRPNLGEATLFRNLCVELQASLVRRGAVYARGYHASAEAFVRLDLAKNCRFQYLNLLYLPAGFVKSSRCQARRDFQTRRSSAASQ